MKIRRLLQELHDIAEGDVERRDLERRAAAGDETAKAKLTRSQSRTGQLSHEDALRIIKETFGRSHGRPVSISGRAAGSPAQEAIEKAIESAVAQAASGSTTGTPYEARVAGEGRERPAVDTYLAASSAHKLVCYVRTLVSTPSPVGLERKRANSGPRKRVIERVQEEAHQFFKGKVAPKIAESLGRVLHGHWEHEGLGNALTTSGGVREEQGKIVTVVHGAFNLRLDSPAKETALAAGLTAFLH